MNIRIGRVGNGKAVHHLRPYENETRCGITANVRVIESDDDDVTCGRCVRLAAINGVALPQDTREKESAVEESAPVCRNLKLYDGTVRCFDHMDASSYVSETDEPCLYCAPVEKSETSDNSDNEVEFVVLGGLITPRNGANDHPIRRNVQATSRESAEEIMYADLLKRLDVTGETGDVWNFYVCTSAGRRYGWIPETSDDLGWGSERNGYRDQYDD